MATAAAGAPELEEPTQPSLLAVVLDARLVSWGDAGGAARANAAYLPAFTELLDALLIFINAYMLLGDGNQLVFVVAHPHRCEAIYPPRAEGPEGSKPAAAARHGQAEGTLLVPACAPPPKEQLYEVIERGVKDALSKALAVESSGTAAGTSHIAGAMSLALCYANRFVRRDKQLLPRMLVLGASADSADQYVAMMNAIFAAKKMSMKIDAAVFGDVGHSAFLHQATHMTGGLYWHPAAATPVPTRVPCWHHELFCRFLADNTCRSYLRSPPRADSLALLDERPVCFSTGEKLENGIGYVCSVCLAIFKDVLHPPKVICPTCREKMKLPGDEEKEEKLRARILQTRAEREEKKRRKKNKKDKKEKKKNKKES